LSGCDLKTEKVKGEDEAKKNCYVVGG